MRIAQPDDSPMRKEDMEKAMELYKNYYNILSLTLSAHNLGLLDELIRCRERMETYRCQEWYQKRLDKASK